MSRAVLIHLAGFLCEETLARGTICRHAEGHGPLDTRSVRRPRGGTRPQRARIQKIQSNEFLMRRTFFQAIWHIVTWIM